MPEGFGDVWGVPGDEEQVWRLTWITIRNAIVIIVVAVVIVVSDSIAEERAARPSIRA